MLTIGEFAQATGLTAKALRLYDELGLLAPADVDERTGYRRYAPDQVDRARLVARLRSAGVGRGGRAPRLGRARPGGAPAPRGARCRV